MDAITEFLGSAGQQGIRLWLQDDQLHYEAPKGAIGRAELDRLKALKTEIIAALKAHKTEQPALQSAPLAFSQLAHWHLYQLGTRPSIRNIASATRLSGPLDVRALRTSIAEIARRQAALRTRIRLINGAPTQEIAATNLSSWELEDLSGVAADRREQEVLRRIEDLIMAPIDVTREPLVAFKLLALEAEEHVLVIAMEHMVSDAFSMGLLQRELFAVYPQIVQGRAADLPPVKMQFPDYAASQRRKHQSWLAEHGGYWLERMVVFERMKFPEDVGQTAGAKGWGMAPLQIVAGRLKQLREWSRSHGTTVAMAVLSAQAALTLRWCGTSLGVIQFVTDGRHHSELANTIGFFASHLYLRIEMSEEDTFATFLKKVEIEYFGAYQHADGSFFEARSPRPQFARNTCLNWIPQMSHSDQPESIDGKGRLTCAPLAFEHPMLKTLERDNEPVIQVYDSESEISGGIYFPLARFSVHQMQAFKQSFDRFIDCLIAHPSARLNQIPLG
jgi:hypothetical protein